MPKLSSYYVFVNDKPRGFEEFIGDRCASIQRLSVSQLPEKVKKIKHYFQENCKKITFKCVFKIEGVAFQDLKLYSALGKISGVIGSDFQDKKIDGLCLAMNKVKRFHSRCDDAIRHCMAMRVYALKCGEGVEGAKLLETIEAITKHAFIAYDFEADLHLSLIRSFDEVEFVHWG